MPVVLAQGGEEPVTTMQGMTIASGTCMRRSAAVNSPGLVVVNANAPVIRQGSSMRMPTASIGMMDSHAPPPPAGGSIRLSASSAA